MRCYVRSTAVVDRLVISYDRVIAPGYAWIFPLRNNEYNVGCGVFYRHGVRGDVNLRQMFERFVATFPEAREVMRAATAATPLKGAPLRCGLSSLGQSRVPRVLAIGETIGTTFPFTGEGIGKAMETGELAAEALGEAIASDDPGHLDRFHRHCNAYSDRNISATGPPSAGWPGHGSRICSPGEPGIAGSCAAHCQASSTRPSIRGACSRSAASRDHSSAESDRCRVGVASQLRRGVRPATVPFIRLSQQKSRLR